MRSLLKDKLLEALGAVAPLIVVVTVLQVSIVGAPTVLFPQFLPVTGSRAFIPVFTYGAFRSSGGKEFINRRYSGSV
jgi:hypothetical protein